MLSKEQYARASGLRALAENGAQVLGPFLAGLLMMWQGLSVVMLVDMATVVVALFTLQHVRTPQTPAKAGDRSQSRHFWQEVGFGFRYVYQRPGLAGMTLLFTGMNFIATLTYFSILSTMILARSDGNEFVLASVQAMLGAAGALGAVVMSLWGGPRRRIHGVLASAALSFLLGDLLLGVGRSLPVWLAGAFFGLVFVPIIGGSNDAIWQRKVAPALQGRVFTAKNMVGQALVPLGYVLGGLLADRWFEPAMTPGGALAEQFGWLVGTGPGAGMALMFVCTALMGVALSLAGYAFRAVREVEEDLADFSLPHGAAASSQPA
jgi:DHA3 family macrolide efflux protein-like MFS transporter